jgi:hypothetical protein
MPALKAAALVQHEAMLQGLVFFARVFCAFFLRVLRADSLRLFLQAY